MTSDQPTGAYVWVFPRGEPEPVVAGFLLQRLGASNVTFRYERSYLDRKGESLYDPELPVRPGLIDPIDGANVAGVINDAAPGGWGQRVILNRVLGTGARDADPASLNVLMYLLQSGSDRIGALDFQASPTEYMPRERSGTLEALMTAAQRVEEGVPFSDELDSALLDGSSVGGARPKALFTDSDGKYIAKFSSQADPYSIVKGEYVAMRLAALVGLDVAEVQLRDVLGKDVLLVRRFDRDERGARRSLVSALTILELAETLGRYASYSDLALQIRARFTDTPATLRELFSRITFNILVGNNDDHARNHAAFWNGQNLELAPAFDVCPQSRAGGETAQAMAISAEGFRMSQVAGCIAAAREYGLTTTEARDVVDHQISEIETHWDDIADEAHMTQADKQYFWNRQFLNPYSLESY